MSDGLPTGHDLWKYLGMGWRWKWLFLACVVVLPVAVYVLESRQPTVYASSALVGINNVTIANSPSGGGEFATSNVDTIATLVNTAPIAKTAATLMKPPADPGQILGEVSASANSATSLITISATDPNPQRAADIANSFARALALNQRQALISQIDSSIASVNSQMRQIKPGDAGAKASLQQQLVQLRATRKQQIETSNVALLNPAGPSSSPASPHVRRAVVLALMIGLMLGLTAVALADRIDRRVRAPEDFERLLGLPLLASIAPTAFAEDLSTSPQDEAAFYMLHATLTRYHGERLESVLVTSAGEEDGKTTVALRLALVAARAGLRVALVDADLRQAQVGRRLGVTSTPGLADVLGGAVSVEDAIVEVEVPNSEGRTLQVLVAGSSPPDASALFVSAAAAGVLRELEATNDLVIVDSPPALVVSDSIAIASLVSGVLIVGRVNHTRQEGILRLAEMLVSAHGRLMGVVATGVSRIGGYYQYDYGTGTNGVKQSRVRNGDAAENGNHARARDEEKAPAGV